MDVYWGRAIAWTSSPWLHTLETKVQSRLTEVTLVVVGSGTAAGVFSEFPWPSSHHSILTCHRLKRCAIALTKLYIIGPSVLSYGLRRKPLTTVGRDWYCWSVYSGINIVEFDLAIFWPRTRCVVLVVQLLGCLHALA